MGPLSLAYKNSVGSVSEKDKLNSRSWLRALRSRYYLPQSSDRNGREGILLLLVTVGQLREGRRVGTWHPAAALILHRDGMFPLLHYVTKELIPILEIQRS